MIDRNIILGKLKEKQRTIKSIADYCGCSQNYVHRLLKDGPTEDKTKSKKYKVLKEIANEIEKDFEEVWGVSETIWTGNYNRESKNPSG
jgi:hypothetical protein